MGVVFTMILVRNGEPIAAQRRYISNVKDLDMDVPVLDQWMRENKTFFADAPEYGVPVALLGTSNPTQQAVVREIEDFVTEFERLLWP